MARKFFPIIVFAFFVVIALTTYCMIISNYSIWIEVFLKYAAEYNFVNNRQI